MKKVIGSYHEGEDDVGPGAGGDRGLGNPRFSNRAAVTLAQV